MTRKRNNLLSIALVLLLVLVTTLTFAYWDVLTGQDNGSINLGQGKTLTVENAVVVENGNLIPNGALKGEGDVYEVVITYVVSVDAEDATYDLYVWGETNDDLLVMDIAITTNAMEDAQVTLTFTLTEPADQAAYTALQAKDLTYLVNFAYSNVDPR